MIPSPMLVEDMQKKNIDIKAVLAILDDINSGRRGHDPIPTAVGVPPLDGKTIIPLGSAYRINKKTAEENLKALSVNMPKGAIEDGKDLVFGNDILKKLGEELYSITAWGILNGGLATSYADKKKNEALIPGLFEVIKPGFERMAPLCDGRPKGLAPAYINPDGSQGESFILLKMRAALVKAESYMERFGSGPRPVLPMFQMSSDGTDLALARAYEEYGQHPWISGLIKKTGSNPCTPLSAKQPLLAALSHSTKGLPKSIFDQAYGKDKSSLALPGGHGQSYAVLKDVYKSLLSQGYVYAYIGNVDNIGYSPEPRELAIMALSGAEAAFEYSYRSAVDIKGGVLIQTGSGRRTVADIGQAISFDKVLELEKRGEKVLFNCATGLFDLRQIVPKLDEIALRLPLRVSDQDKDAGLYSQAEQSTWEVVGLLDNPLGFAVNKSERFIAAKLLAETLLASLPAGTRLPEAALESSKALSEGLAAVLQNTCKLRLDGGVWRC